ncbi:ATP-binding protein [Marinobacter sediminum]|uniref:AAA family ATPase n=1 Tax=Marinobacter sediminum TaxID=256323 RepID=UPI00202DF1EC|nr:AAA family ATPase [Marinobacter sediminum]MCM0613389.1 ATP-binding protein [Marinobacter sediminum]
MKMKPISQMELRFGATRDSEALSIVPTGITLFVGPNNSGKSLILKEIERFCNTYQSTNNKILQNLDFNVPPYETVKEDIERKKTPPNENEQVGANSIIVQRLNAYQGQKPREVLPIDQLETWVNQRLLPNLTRFYFSFLTVRLDGETRTTLLRPNNRGDLLATPTNILAALWTDPEARAKIRDLTSEAFGTYFTIDALNANQLRARMSKRPPADEAEEQSLDQRARDFHRDATEIIYASDGVKAFTGMLATVLGQDYKIPLIDEPEAFLHPPLARRLGKELAAVSGSRDACSFIATHSADFLMGCVQGSDRVNIVRLTHKGDVSTARLLSHDRLNEIIKSPLMRSSGVLSALFHEGAVVCEADADRALYQEINDRLAQFETSNSSEALFLNAIGKQSVAKIAGPLREMGIPAAIAVDFDIFKKGVEFKQMLREISISSALINTWCQFRAELAQYCEDHGVDWKKGGIRDFEGEMKPAAEQFLRNLADYGIFVVPIGEVEAWLGYLNIPPEGGKRNWLLNAFNTLGHSTDSETYVRPEEGDIWDFVRDISAWVNNPERHGV